MNRLIRVDTEKIFIPRSHKLIGHNKSFQSVTDTDDFIKTLSNDDEDKTILLTNYCNKYKKFIIDYNTLVLVIGIYKEDNTLYLDDEYFTSSEYEFIDLSESVMFMDYEPVCVFKEDNLKLFAKNKMTNKYLVNWDFFLYGDLENVKL